MSGPEIDSYQFGKIVVDGQAFTKDIIILPERVIPNWRRKSGHNLCVADLKSVFEAQPQALVIGQGAAGRMRVPAQVEQALQEAGIQPIVLPSGEAWRHYNELRSQRRTAAALHLTC